MNEKYKSPLHQTVATTRTDFWNDSCSTKDLTYAMEHGAVGATTNPTIVLSVLHEELNVWSGRIKQIIAEHPDWSEVEVSWQLIEEIAVKGASLLYPIFEREKGRKGRISIQTNPANYRNSIKLTEQAIHFNTLAPNMQVKIPVTKAGIKAIEEATYNGININATVCFTVPQSIAVAEAIERGMNRRTAEGKPVEDMTPVCTIMVGRTDDWLKTLAERDGIIVEPGHLNWAGIACFKKSYKIYQERKYHTRLLAAAYRHHLHWSELIGGDVVLTIPYQWQLRFNASDIEVVERIQNPVPQEIIDDLYNHFEDFRKAYDEDGLSIDEFDSYGATVRTLRGFISSYHDLQKQVREFLLPNPDAK
jgi:transaldolase